MLTLLDGEVITGNNFWSEEYTCLQTADAHRLLCMPNGILTTVKVWFDNTAGNFSGKVGTFSGSGTSWDDRDYEAISTSNLGSVVTFGGLNIEAHTDDALGIYSATGSIVYVNEAGHQTLSLLEDTFGQGVHTYDTDTAGYRLSIAAYGYSFPDAVTGISATDNLTTGVTVTWNKIAN